MRRKHFLVDAANENMGMSNMNYFYKQFPCCVLVTLKSLHSNFAQTLQPLPIFLPFVKPKALGLNLILTGLHL